MDSSQITQPFLGLNPIFHGITFASGREATVRDDPVGVD